jgi:AbrB family looped-hinge helix DNA binding protein
MLALRRARGWMPVTSTFGSPATGMSLGSRWYRNPMEAVIDSVGRTVLPKQLRDALGLTPGTKVDISPYGSGVQITPGGHAQVAAWAKG